MFLIVFWVDGGKNVVVVWFSDIKYYFVDVDYFLVIFISGCCVGDYKVRVKLFYVYVGWVVLLQIVQGGFVSQQVRVVVGEGEWYCIMVFYLVGQLWFQLVQLDIVFEKVVELLVNGGGCDEGGKMVVLDFGWFGLCGEIIKMYYGVVVVWCGQVKVIMQWCWNKFYYLWKLVSGNKGFVGFGDYKQVIEGQVVDISKGVGQVYVVYGFNRMNKKL